MSAARFGLVAGFARWGFLLWLCALLPLAGLAQTPRDPRLDDALALADAGQGRAAVALAEAVLAAATTEAERWPALETLASIAHLEGRDADARDLLPGVIDSGAVLHGEDSPRLLPALRMLAASEGNLGNEAAATPILLRALRIARTAALESPADGVDDLLHMLSDLSRHNLDLGENQSAALLAAELVIQSQNQDGTERPEAQEGRMLRALAQIRMGRPVDAASHALAVWRLGGSMTPDAADLASVLDEEFADAAGDEEVEARLSAWIEAATIAETDRDARLSASNEALGPMMAAFGRGDPVAADRAARSAFDLVESDDPLAVNAYFALMIGTFDAGRTDLAATWAFRLADMPSAYLAGLVEDPALLFREIAASLLSDGRARDAARLTESALELASLRGRSQDVEVQRLLSLLGAAQRDMGDSAAAEDTLTRAIALGPVPGPEPDRARATLQALSDLALLLTDTGRPDEAMAVFDRGIAALETGPAGRESAGWLYLLPDYLPLLVKSGQTARAIALADRGVAAALAESASGKGPAIRAYILLARTRLALDDPRAALDAAENAVALAQSDPAADPRDLAEARVIEAAARVDAGLGAAPDAILAALPGAATDAGLLVQIAVERANAGDPAGARRLLSLAAATLPPDSPAQPYLTATDGAMALKSGDAEAALHLFRAATQTLTQPERRGEPRARDHLPLHVDTALRLAETAPEVQSLSYATEAFQVAQRVNDLSAGAALGRAAARLRAPSPEAAPRARDLEAAERGLAAAREALLARLAEGSDATAERAGLEAARQTLARARDALAEVFPQYGAFADPRPLDLASTTRLLGPDEVLVLFATSDMEGIGGAEPSVVLALTAEGYVWAPLPARAELVVLAQSLRCAAAQTDPGCGRDAGGTRGAVALDTETVSPRASFDYETARSAYSTLLEPVSAAFAGKTSLIVVPDRALAAMPFHLLLTDDADPGLSPRDAPWLIRRMSVSVAPSVASLAALRVGASRRSTAPLPFLGIGDPLIGAQRAAALPTDCARFAEPAVLTAALDSPRDALLRGEPAARADAVAALPALPETRCELAAIAARFGQDSQVLLQAEATETALKAMSASGELERYRVLSFATHGLVAGELGDGQGGLVLTPPAAATAEDDGLLTTEDIAGLRLDADFILLSACNTAAGTRAVDDSLSGLASAFFLAGARSVLVSHWPVYSDAAVRLTTGMIGAVSADPAIGRAEALRRSMLAILDDPESDASMLHPAYWGPFIIAGDGGAG